MGCSISKSEETGLVIRCRERKELIRRAANQRYDLAAAHVSYFSSLKHVGDSLRKFVDEEFVFGNNSSSSSSSSSSVSLHSLDFEQPPQLHKITTSTRSTDSTNNNNNKHNFNGDHLDLSSPMTWSSPSPSPSEDEFHHHQDSNNNVMRGRVKEELDSPFAHRDYHHVDDNYNTNEYSYPSNGFGFGFGFGFGSGSGSGSGSGLGVNRPPPQGYWGGDGGGDYGMNPWGMPPYYAVNNTNAYYMKKAFSKIKTVLQQPDPITNAYMTSYFNYPNQNGDVTSHPIAAAAAAAAAGPTDGPGKRADVPLPPSPKASVWDFINPFDSVDESGGYYPQTGYGYGYDSIVSSPDSDEVREREGIPKLEEETESEYQKSNKERQGIKTSSREVSDSSTTSVPIQKNEANLREMPAHWDNEGHVISSKSASSRKIDGSLMGMSSHVTSEGSTNDIFMHKTSEESPKEVPLHKTSGGGSSIEMPSHSNHGSAMPGSSRYHDDSSIAISSKEDDEIPDSIHHRTEENSNSNPTIVKSTDDGNVNTKGVTFDLHDTSKPDFDSSKLSSLTAISVHGTRDLREVVAEIRDDFEVASSYGKEVALMLEVGKIPYQPSFIKVILSRMMYLVSPSALDLHAQSLQSVKLASKTMKLAKSIFADFGEGISMKHYNLSSTLDELYAWEKKLYKEVKEEERLRIIYEKQCKRLKLLDQQGAETGKIDSAHASVRELQTKLSISIKTINVISSKIHKLRDTELQPQVSELIHGMTRMWKSMLKCHRKQFHSIMESKIRTLRANTALERESSVRATHELQRELVSWCRSFGDWISTQKSYVESLNAWLLRCLDYEPEESADGPVPFSPGHLGAPPMFVICHDWNQALEAISDSNVADAMHDFASILRQMWEKQDEEYRQRLKAEEMSKGYKQWMESLQTDGEKVKINRHTRSDKTGKLIASENGVSQLDDLKVDLDSLRKRLGEERAKHKDAIRMVHDAASTTIQGGLVPIFKALENFTCEALKAHEHVRFVNTNQTL